MPVPTTTRAGRRAAWIIVENSGGKSLTQAVRGRAPSACSGPECEVLGEKNRIRIPTVNGAGRERSARRESAGAGRTSWEQPGSGSLHGTSPKVHKGAEVDELERFAFG